MNFDVDKILKWVRTRIEIGTAATILTGAVTYVGRSYYGAYFDFYSIPESSVETSLFDNIMISIVVAIFSVALIGVIYLSQEDEAKGFWGLFRDNVPLFVVLLLGIIVAVEIYWTNVESLSSWISSLISSPEMVARNKILTGRVEFFLRWMIVFSPVPTALVLVVFASFRGFSFSRFLMRRSTGIRIFFLCLYLLLLLHVCGIWGRATAFAEFTGLLNKPEVVVTLTDGQTFQPDKTLYLVAQDSSTLCFSSKSFGNNSPVSAWIVPQGSVKYMQTKPGSTQWNVLLDYFKK